MIGGVYMASLIMHAAVAKEVNKKLCSDEKKYMLGALSPDLAKRFGVSRKKSHFVTDKFAPNIDLFLQKYGGNINDDFVLGYYIHLLTDYYWEKKFIPKIFNGKIACFRNGKRMYCTYKRFMSYIYKDYDNLDLLIKEKHDLNFENLKNVNVSPIIKEIPLQDICNFDFNCLKYLEYDKKQVFFIDKDQANQFIIDATKFVLEKLEAK